ncbi:MAG: DUF86 domain-containing protein [Chloroflexi bacterium]|nr:DUF86 domain-containing protein [Chloroflexota bacterium]
MATMKRNLARLLKQKLPALNKVFAGDPHVLGVFLFGSQADGTATAQRGKTFEDFVLDADLKDAAKYRLQTAVQAMIDIAQHICARLRLKVATDSGECIRTLEKQGLLSRERATTYVKMARFRNVLVHLYGEVDDHRVHEIVGQERDSFRMFLADVDMIIEKYQKKEKNGSKKIGR